MSNPKKNDGTKVKLDLVKVDFYGDQIEAAKDGDGKVWVSLKRCCKNLGISMQVQLRKLKNNPDISVTIMVTQVETDDQPRSYAMIELKSLPLWLITIEANKVKPTVKEKLLRYRAEAKEVLADYFFGRRQQTPAPEQFSPEVLLKAMVSLIDARFAGIAEKLEEQISERVFERVDSAIQRAIADRGMIPSHEPYWTIRRRVNELNWYNPSPSQMRRIRYYANGLISAALGEIPVSGERDLHYTKKQLPYLDRAIYVILRETEERQNGGLFGNGPAN